jgi:septum site-determining protein MinC
MHPKVQIKGIREGLLVILGEGTWEELRVALLNQLDQQSDFLQGARLAIDVGNHVLDVSELEGICSEFTRRQLTLWAVISESAITEQNVQSLGLGIQIGRTAPDPESPFPGTNLLVGDEAILLRRTLRSGYSLKNAGHVIVIGDVNPGAEIISGGDVVVWGRLRGVVHAGASGREDSVVCALDLSPTQLRIAGLIALTPKRRGKPLPELARIQDGQVVAEPWDPKRDKL